VNEIQNIPGKLTRLPHPFLGWGDETHGAAMLKLNSGGIASILFAAGRGWEHVSVSMKERCATWDEMTEVRDIFWPADVWVLQYHPPRKEYITSHVLHLWKPDNNHLPTPQPWAI
jgi:hypothetical protein